MLPSAGGSVQRFILPPFHFISWPLTHMALQSFAFTALIFHFSEHVLFNNRQLICPSSYCVKSVYKYKYSCPTDMRSRLSETKKQAETGV